MDGQTPEGHRRRLKNKYLKSGENSLRDNEILELLLFYANKRTDTKPAASKLAKSFDGDFNAIFGADPETLKLIEGVGESGAELLSFVGRFNEVFFRRIKTVADFVYTGEPMAVKEFAVMFCLGMSEACVNLVLLGSSGKFTEAYELDYEKLCSDREARNAAAREALTRDCTGALIITYRGENAYLPDETDAEFTREMLEEFRSVDISLFDHIIVNEKGSFSMSADYRYCQIF